MAQIETNIEAKNGKGVGFERIRRITGYLVKRSEMEKFRAHQVVLQNTTHLGTANYDTNHLERRKVRMV